MSPLETGRILVSADNGVDPGVVSDRLRGSWGILVRHYAAPHAATRPRPSQGSRL
jgi:hypothetical protein